MVPLVGAPAVHVAGSIGVLPGVIRASGRASVDGVVPALDPAIALKAHDDGLSIGHGLVEVKFEIGEAIGRACDVDPAIVEEILRGGVIVELDAVALAPEVIELVGKEARCSRHGWGTGHAHGAAGRARGSPVVDGNPVAERLNGADLDRTGRDHGVACGGCTRRAADYVDADVG